MNNSHAPLDTSSSVSSSSVYIPPHKKNQSRQNNQNDSVDSSTNAAPTNGAGRGEKNQNQTRQSTPRHNNSAGSSSGPNPNYKGNRSTNRSNTQAETTTSYGQKSQQQSRQPRNNGQTSNLSPGTNPLTSAQEPNRLDLSTATPSTQQTQTQTQAPSNHHNTPSNKFSSNNSSTGAFVSPVLPQRDPNEDVLEPTSAPTQSSSYNRSFQQKGKRHTALRALPPEEKAKQEFELFGEARTGIDFAIYDDIPAQASGENCPKAIKSFQDISFGPHLSQTLLLCGYERPTPIQKYSLPIAMARRDMIACAQTGSGKTAAFLLPTIFQLFNNEIPPLPESADNHKSYRRIQAPQALILGPTRELVTQTYKEACKLTYMTTIRPVVVYGGVPIQEQIRQLAMGCHILVATPGRLQDLCSRNNISLCNITILILDEADCMLDMGFAPQIEDVITKYQMPIQERQTLMFSATFPAEIQRLAKTYLSNYVYVTIGRVGSSTSLVTQRLLPSPQREDDKRESLLQLLDGCDGLTLIFVETRRSADLLEHFLTDHDINAASIHGDRSQYEREQALSLFKSGHCPVLVATDVASRGLSIPNVEFVINYDMPTVIDDYVHRIGRTGRCGARGIATSFIGEKNRGLAMDLLDNMREAKQIIPEFLQALVDSSRSGSSGYGYGNSRYGNSHKGKQSTPRFAANQDVRYSGGSSSAAANALSSTPSAPSNTYTKTTGNTYGSNSNSNDEKVNVGTYGVSSSAPQKKNNAPQTKTFSASSFTPQPSTGTSALHGVQAQDDAW